MKIKQMLKKKFLNADGTVNGTVVASFITLLILLVQEMLAIFGIKFTGDWSQIAGAVNTVLAILSAAGFVEGQGKVELQGSQQSAGIQTPGVTLQDMIDNPMPGTTVKQTAPASVAPSAPEDAEAVVQSAYEKSGLADKQKSTDDVNNTQPVLNK